MLPRTIALSMLVLVAGPAGCDQLANLGKLDPKRMSDQIETTLEADGAAIKTITCPEGQEDKDGVTFTCNGEAEDGTKFEVKASAQGGGAFSWKLTGRIVDPAELQRALKEDVGVEFDCGKQKRIVTKGVEMDCKHGEDVVAFKYTDDDGGREIIGLLPKQAAIFVEKALEGEGVGIKSVTCPPGKKDGDLFECDGEADDGTKFKAKIDSTNGMLRYALVGRIVTPEVIHENLKTKTGHDFDCGKGKRIAVKGVEIDCKSGSDVVAIKYVDDEGAVEVSESNPGGAR